MFAKIVVTYAGSPEADPAPTAAICLAKIMGEGLHTITMLEGPPALSLHTYLTESKQMGSLQPPGALTRIHRKIAVTSTVNKGVFT